MKTSNLAEQIAQKISQQIASGQLAVGDPLRAQTLADRFNVSRSPIREALKILTDAGVVEQKTNRGFYVTGSKNGGGDTVPLALTIERESPYQRVADDWRNNVLPEEVTEQFLRDRYKLTKAQVQDILVRAAREGWAERKPGYGWSFLNVAKSTESFQQIYQFRMVIEPAAMLSPDYEVVPEKLEELRAAQQRMLDHDIQRLPVEQLLATGAAFHEELIKFANNPYFHMALVRVNQMRRLLEYRAAYKPDRFIEQSRQHLIILDLLSRGEVLEASFAMKKHLSGALTSKAELIRALEPASAS
ncbi:GntR family transcriptional regulator [uncultured Roseibium sp.]|uniref:GntR family transcriptional regulator n=1 Tax=uncultured Roseibium sp. TaxID=1936171 RepID=UPI00261EF806|nr:GntR family transcriptional regulator [uncultured Roseibium sp.]